jgi:putative tryptophan/tyrosine transport system substrate-binding protein
MLRILVFFIASLIASGDSAPSLGADPSAVTPRVILYVDADSPAVKAGIARFETALAHRGILARHHVVVRHVPVDVFAHAQAAQRIAAALRDHPAMLIASSSESALIARSVTSDVPIVFGSHQDPVRLGLVRSLANPAGNLTGFTFFVPIDMKRLELLREIAPKAHRLGIVIDHWWMRETDGESILRAAKSELGFDARVFMMEKPEDLRVLQGNAAREMDAWYVPPTTLPYEHPAAMVRALASLRKPAVFPHSMFVDAGALMVYQPKISVDDALDLFARIAGLILDGVPTSEIPVERPKSFELIVNVGEARRLGIPLPEELLKRADRVVDETPQAASR